MEKSKEEIKSKLVSNVYTLTDSKNNKSEVWQKFKCILDENCAIIENFVACSKCLTVLSYVKQNGCSSMNRHKCPQGTNGSRKISSFFPTKTAPVIPENHKKEINAAFGAFVVLDLRPMEAVAGAGMQEVCQSFYNLGASMSRPMSVKDIIPHPTTISRHVSAIAPPARKNLETIVYNVCKNSGGGGAMTTDLWTDRQRSKSYISLTFHYIEDVQLKSRCLFVLPLGTESKDADFILRQILKMLKSLNIPEEWMRCKIVFVTDRGTNIVSALKEYQRINCFAHLLHNVVQHAFLDDEAKKIVANCQKLVKYFKKAQLQEKLTKTIKQDVPTRWNGTLTMMASIVEMWDEILETLEDRGESSRLQDLQKNSIQNLIEFLQPFEDATKETVAEKMPTLHLVTLWRTKLKQHLASKIDTYAKLALDYFHKNLILEDVHYLATFLHPLLKHMRMFSQQEKKIVEHFLEEELSKISLSDDDAEEQVLYSSLEPTPKKQKMATVEEFFQTSGSTSSEWKKYKNFEVPQHANLDLISWWNDHQNFFPKLHSIAMRIHAIPATSTPSERLFSQAGNLITDKRSRIDPEKVDDILVLKSNWDLTTK
ncbi:zinc finger BED domain-containing protein 1-like [Sergentomyia squamirostris]